MQTGVGKFAGGEGGVNRGVRSWSISWGEGERLANSRVGNGMEREAGPSDAGFRWREKFRTVGGKRGMAGKGNSMQRCAQDDDR